MRALFKKYPILCTAILISLVCVVILLGIRIHTETNNRSVSAIISFHHVERIAEAAQEQSLENPTAAPAKTLPEYLTAFAEMGVAAIVLTPVDGEYDLEQAALVKEAGMDVVLANARYMPLATYARYREELDNVYPLYYGYGLPVGKIREDEEKYVIDYSETEAYFEEEGVALGLVEDKGQYGHTHMDDFMDNTRYGKMVRVFRLIPSFADRYAVLGYEGAGEIENVLYRAVTDRNIRVLLLTPFVHNETREIITNTDEYAEVLTNLASRIARQNIYFGQTFSAITFYRISMVLLALLSIGLFAWGIFLLMTLFRVPKPLRAIIFGIGVLFAVYGVIFQPFYVQTLMALGAAAIFPCFAIYATTYYLKQVKEINSYGRLLLTALIALAIAIGIALLGGAYVGANLSNSKYMLEITTFRGVKVSQMLPLMYAAIMIFQQLYHIKGVSLRRRYRNFRSSADRQKKIAYMVIFLVLLAAVGLFILRTGDRIIQAGDLEQRFRIFLEVELTVRPRTKEFLIAWPALVVATFCLGIQRKHFAWPFLFAATIGCASVVNTFCHIRSHYLLSVLRTLYGAAFGMLLGLVAISLLWLVYYLWRRHRSTPSQE